MNSNLVDRIGSEVTIWCKDGNCMGNRTLFTLDSYGIVVSGWNDKDLCVFVPWIHVNYIDYTK
jgi:hypothetical protein